MSASPEHLRVVLDTNVLISGTIVPQGASATILNAWRQEAFTLLMSSWQRAEIGRVLVRPRIVQKYHLTDERIVAFFLLLDTLTVQVAPLEALPVTVRDAQDNAILGMALAGRARCLVTGDDDLLTLADHPALDTLQILNPRAFSAILPPP